MRRNISRLVRTAAVAALTGAIALGPLGALSPAGADLGQFTSTGQSFALRVTIDLSGLPAAAKAPIQSAYATLRGALPALDAAGLPAEFPFVIDQYFVKTTSDASSNVTRAVSNLGEGFINLGSVSADGNGQSNSRNVQNVQIPSAQLPLIDATAGILKATVAAGPKVDGTGSLAEVGADLQILKQILPQDLQNAIANVINTVNTTVDSLDTTLDSVAQPVVDLVAGTPLASAPVVGPIVSSVPALASALDIPDIPNPLETQLASIQGLVSTSVSERAVGLSTADATSKITSVDVLGGLLKVGLIDLASHSEAAGIPGSAKNTSRCSLADVRIGGDTGVSLDGKNLFVQANGVPVPVPVPAVDIAGIKSQVDSLLAAVGLKVSLCDGSQAEAAADGSSASQAVSAFRVEFAPKAPVALPALGIGAGDALIKVIIDPTVTTAVAANQAQVVRTPGSSPVQLPRTGAGMLATMVGGTGLAGAALFLRRKFR